MKNQNEIVLVMSKLNLSQEDIETLSDETFETVVHILTNPQPRLSEKELAWAQDIAERLSKSK